MNNYYTQDNVVYVNRIISVEAFALLKKLGYIIHLSFSPDEV